MKSAVVWILLTIVLAVAGYGFWRTGQFERRMVAAQQRLLTMDYSVTVGAFDDLAHGDSMVVQLPSASPLSDDVRRAKAKSQFWAGDYAALQREPGDSDAATQNDPDVLLVAANAAFRLAAPSAANRSSIPMLERILQAYGEVLKQAPGEVTAAYNYEYVARLRDRLLLPSSAPATSAARVVAPPDTIHGPEGGRPDDPDMSPFQTLEPLEGDERRETEEAGKNRKRVRRG